MKDARPGQGISIRVTLIGYKTPCWRPVQARTFDHSVSQRGLLASIRIQKSEKDTDKMGSLTDDAEAAHPTFLFFGDSIWPSVLTSLWHSRHQAHDLGIGVSSLVLNLLRSSCYGNLSRFSSYDSFRYWLFRNFEF